MVLEVNNTFDERRMYFLKCTASDDPAHNEGNNQAFSSRPDSDRFVSSWPKDFHVSPFNSRQGSYSLTAKDPFSRPFPNSNLHPFLTGDLLFEADAWKEHIINPPSLNNTITLSSSKQHAKLVARVYSTSPCVDPSILRKRDFYMFLLSWWWVGFVTIPRIVREAAKLFFRRRLHVWYRPEVLRDSIGRSETNDERYGALASVYSCANTAHRAIAMAFRDYLRTVVESSNLKVSLRFTSGIANGDDDDKFTPHSWSLSHSASNDPVTFKVTTPLFYAQIARQTNFAEYFKGALSEPDDKTRVFHTSKPDTLIRLFETSQENRSKTSLSQLPLADRLRWSLIRLLRRFPYQSAHCSLSPLDTHSIRAPVADFSKARSYRRSVLKLLVSDYVAFSMPAVIDAILSLTKLWLCWTCVKSFEELSNLTHGKVPLTLIDAGRVILGCGGLHIWWGLGQLL